MPSTLSSTGLQVEANDGGEIFSFETTDGHAVLSLGNGVSFQIPNQGPEHRMNAVNFDMLSNRVVSSVSKRPRTSVQHVLTSRDDCDAFLNRAARTGTVASASYVANSKEPSNTNGFNTGGTFVSSDPLLQLFITFATYIPSSIQVLSSESTFKVNDVIRVYRSGGNNSLKVKVTAISGDYPEGDAVLLTTSTDATQNGLYTFALDTAATRHTAFSNGTNLLSLSRSLFYSASEYYVLATLEGTVGSTDLLFESLAAEYVNDVTAYVSRLYLTGTLPTSVRDFAAGEAITFLGNLVPQVSLSSTSAVNGFALEASSLPSDLSWAVSDSHVNLGELVILLLQIVKDLDARLQLLE